MKGLLWFLCIVSCVMYLVDGGTTCLSCSGVESVIDCTHLERCRNDEICFAHKYVTESKAELYDFGCTYQKLCIPGSFGSGFGRRLSEGHHIVCQTCCNDTDICNMKSSCVTNVAHNTSTGQSTNSKLPRECDDLSNTTTGVYTIYPDGVHPTQVYCIMANNEKWTVIQRRFNGFVDFYQDWMNYKKGFGPVAGEYWLGNDNIHTISASAGHKLSIYLEDFNNNFKYANYSYFLVGDEHRKYQLSIGLFSGTAGLDNELTYHSGRNFTTKDEDNGRHNCGVSAHGGWWYHGCAVSNLNGPYLAGPVIGHASMFWYGFPSGWYSLKKTTMMIKRIS